MINNYELGFERTTCVYFVIQHYLILCLENRSIQITVSSREKRLTIMITSISFPIVRCQGPLTHLVRAAVPVL